MNATLFRGESHVTHPAGATIFATGDEAHAMYAILEGTVEIRVHDHLVTALGPGDLFGEMALIDKRPRSADAIAKTDATLAIIDEKHFLFLVQNHPFFAVEMMRVLAERLRVLDEKHYAGG